jgi:hypothetical protein
MLRLVTLLLAATLLATLPAASAAPVDLGDGLRYVRVNDTRELPETDLNAPLVIDLRRTQGGDLARLGTLLRSNGAVRFVLLGSETSPDVRQLLAARAPGVITLAAEGIEPKADVVLEATPEEDMRAYDAHEDGAELALLIQPPLKKNRRDEAAILRNRANGNGNGNGRGSAAASEDPPPEEAGGEPEESPLVDSVLQRAVHLHRGLKALGRL